MAVLITGASSGIGAACAWAFAAKGKELILVARREEKLKALAEAIRAKHKTTVETFSVDLTKSKAVAAWAKDHESTLKRLTIVVNNAGLARGMDPLQSGDPADWDEMVDTNVKGFLYVSRALLPFLVENRGHMINMGSVAGRWMYPNGNVYAATKYAVRGLTEAMRLDLHGSGVRVTEIAPGMVETEFSEVRFRGDKDRAGKVYAGMKPLSADDIAETVVWCADRPKHVNVQELVIFPVDQASVNFVKRS